MQRVSYNDGGITLSNTQNPVINIYDTSRDPVLVKISGSLECDSVTAGNLALSSTSVSSLQVTNLTALSNIQCNTLTALSSLDSPSISGTLITPSQTNITSLGTLNNLTLTGTLSVAALAGNYASSISSLANLEQLTTVNLSTTDTASVRRVNLTEAGSATNNAIRSVAAGRGINFNSSQVNIASNGSNVLECSDNFVRINRPLTRTAQEIITNQTIGITPTTPFNFYINHTSATVALTITLPQNNEANRTIYVGQTYTFATSGSPTATNHGSLLLNIPLPSNVSVLWGSVPMAFDANANRTLLPATGAAKSVQLMCIFANTSVMRWIVFAYTD